MAGIILERLTKRFDTGHAAVDDVTLEIPDGRFTVLVGPSGCGKSTVLRLVAGLEAPTAGRVIIGDRDVTDLPARQRDLAMVFQNYALYPHLSVRDNIGFGLKMRRFARRDVTHRVREVAESLGIGELLSRRPAQLSGGQRQRVALARAIVREPRAFLFDEPLSNLDAQVRARTRAELIRLQRRLGATMLYVTHDQVEAMTMASLVAVMNGGRIQQVAPPLEIYRTPVTLFVASFVGSPAINRFPGRVVTDDGATRFVGAVNLPVDAPAAPSATLAVRPEHLRLETAEGSTEAAVTLVESLGSETLVHLQFPSGEEAVARADGGAAFAIGRSVRVGVDASRALLYDAQGQLLWRGRA
jgi:multiple sugar transport system ATP-binding protein